VLPRPSRRDVLLSRPNIIPGREPEIGVLTGMLGAFQGMLRDISLREIGYRITPRFKEQKDLLAIGDRVSPEAHAQAAA
jgi:hypothetical protein